MLRFCKALGGFLGFVRVGAFRAFGLRSRALPWSSSPAAFQYGLRKGLSRAGDPVGIGGLQASSAGGKSPAGRTQKKWKEKKEGGNDDANDASRQLQWL